jgi:hypothetical protein
MFSYLEAYINCGLLSYYFGIISTSTNLLPIIQHPNTNLIQYHTKLLLITMQPMYTILEYIMTDVTKTIWITKPLKV